MSIVGVREWLCRTWYKDGGQVGVRRRPRSVARQMTKVAQRARSTAQVRRASTRLRSGRRRGRCRRRSRSGLRLEARGIAACGRRVSGRRPLRQRPPPGRRSGMPGHRPRDTVPSAPAPGSGRGWPEAASVGRGGCPCCTARGVGGGRPGEAGDDRFGEPAARRLDRAHLGEQLAGGRRSLGCLAMQLRPAAAVRGHLTIRRAVDQPVITAAFDPVPNGPWPVAAKVSTAPRPNMSLAGPISAPRTCSARHVPGEPIISLPAAALASAAGDIAQSMTRGPSSASSTLDGFRSPCTTPAAWIALRLSASPAASASTVQRQRPVVAHRLGQRGPATYAVASQGIGLSRSASTTCAVNKPLTFGRRDLAPDRARNSGSVASSPG